MCKDYDAYAEGIRKAKEHNKVSHYTTLGALKCILENESLRLTRLDLVNDTYEEKRTDDLWKGKIFTTCFTYRENESNMFWNLYAKEKGVMLTFDNEFFRKSDYAVCADAPCKIEFPKYEKCDAKHKRNIDYSDWLLRDVTYADITYTSDFEEFVDEDTELKNIFKDCIMVGKNNNFKHSLYSGLIKGIEWDSEQEVRIRVALAYRGISNLPNTGSPVTPFYYVYIPIADALKTMTVTMNPWRCDCFEKELSALLGNNPLTKSCKISDSSMRDQVKR